MKLTYLGHAGFCVETDKSLIVMDPWLSPTGAFDSAWYQFPCNHHMAAYIQTKVRDSGKACYIYISHEHKDHFDIEFLSSLQTNDFSFVIPQFRRTELYDRLQAISCKSIIRCGNGETVQTPDAELTLYLDDSELDRDSAVLVRSDGQSFLNLNDCKIFDQLPQILQKGPVGVFTAQFSGAVWHPVCYNYPKKQYEAISTKKMFSKFEVVAKALLTIQPKLYLASAGPPCFLDPDLLEKNFEKINIFPRAQKLFDYFSKRVKNIHTQWEEPMPGDCFDVSTGKAVYLSQERVSDDNYAEYIRAYAARFAPIFEARRFTLSDNERKQTLDRLKSALKQKLSVLELRDRIIIPLYFSLKESPDQMIRVDFQNNTVEYTSSKSERNFYWIEANTSDIKRVLDEMVTWEDYMLSFRMKLQRDPDIYHVLIHGFLVMDAADMNYFCAKVLGAESNTERTIIEVGDKQYSINRYCPHQGADLSQAWVEQDRYLVCPRHRWKYDLQNEGYCTDSQACIRAVELQ